MDAIDSDCIRWVFQNGEEYAKSNLVFPRDISKKDAEVPNAEPELTLRKIDIEAIKEALHYQDSSPVSREINELQIIVALSGKWLVYERRDNIDEAWRKLSLAIDSGRLPYSAKVSTAKENSNSDDKNLHVVCVYTSNYLFRDDVRKCRAILSSLGFAERLYYKPDIMTHKNMYRVTGSKVNYRYFG
jgi:Domain of unknown function (DUF1917)